MTDAIYSHHRAAAVRYWPIERLGEIACFGILVFMTTRLPQYGKYTTVAWLGLLALLIVVHRREVAATVFRGWPLLLVPLCAALSFLWSDFPQIAGRYGFQLFLTAFAGVLLARCLSPSRFLSVLYLALLVLCVASVALGRKGISAEGAVLIGLVGSKNQMSALGYLLMFSGLAALSDPKVPRAIRLLTPIGMLLGVYIVMTTNSATGMILCVMSVLIFLGLRILQPLRPAGRVGVIVAMMLVAAPIIALAPEIDRGINDFLINVLHKDPGLTGRTYLWAQADELIARRPILGYGFQAFWLSDSPESRSILAWAQQSDGRTFNFHSTIRQFGVDTGIVGMTLLVATAGVGLLAAVRQYVLSPTVATTFFFTFFVVHIGRSFTEVLLVTFSTFTMLVFAALTYAFWTPRNGWGEEDMRLRQPQPGPYPLPPTGRLWAPHAPIAPGVPRGPVGPLSPRDVQVAHKLRRLTGQRPRR